MRISARRVPSDCKEYHQLGDKHPHEHRERIDGGVVQGYILAAIRVLRKCEDRRVRRTSGNEAADLEEIELEHIPAKQGDDQDRHHSDDGSVKNPPPSSVQQRGDDGLACSKADSGKEEGDADFTYHHIRAHRRVCGDVRTRAETAEQDGDDERSSRKTKFDRLRNTWQ